MTTKRRKTTEEEKRRFVPPPEGWTIGQTTPVSGSGGTLPGWPGGGVTYFDPATGLPATPNVPLTQPGVTVNTGNYEQPTAGNGAGPGVPPSNKPGLFDPKMTAIDTTNPHAVPIIKMLLDMFMKRSQAGPQQRSGIGGPMAQLYNNMPKFNPVNAGSTEIRSFQPQYTNQHSPTKFDPDAFLRGL